MTDKKWDDRTSWIYWSKGISTGKYDPMDQFGEEAFPAFLTKRAFSYYPDTLIHTSLINLYPDASNKMIYDYLRFGIRQKSRFSKWGKKPVDDDITMLMVHYRVKREVAQDYLKILTDDQMATIRREEKLKEV
jgi:hypothetical protein